MEGARTSYRFEPLSNCGSQRQDLSIVGEVSQCLRPYGGSQGRGLAEKDLLLARDGCRLARLDIQLGNLHSIEKRT